MHQHGTHQGHALLLTTGKRPGQGVRAVGQAHARQSRHGLRLYLFGRPLERTGGAQHQIAQHIHVWEQIIALKHHAHTLADQMKVLFLPADDLPLQQNFAPVHAFKPVQAAQQGGFAAPAGADHHHHLAAPHAQRHIPQHRFILKSLAQMPRLQQILRHIIHSFQRFSSLPASREIGQHTMKYIRNTTP